MANETIGHLSCPFCSKSADVRRSVRKKLYYKCDACGLVQPTLARFQEWMLSHAKLYGAEGPPESELPHSDVAGGGEIAAPGRLQKADLPPPAPEVPKPLPPVAAIVPNPPKKQRRGILEDVF